MSFSSWSARIVREKSEQTGRIRVSAQRVALCEERFHVRPGKIPRDIWMTTFASDSRDKKDRAARWQLVCKRDGKAPF